MNKRILIVYASSHGTTAEVARAIGEAMGGAGAEVTVAAAADAPAPEGYAAVVLGSPIYSGELLPDLNAYVSAHDQALQALPIALFATSMRMRDGSEEMRQSVLGTLDSLRILLKPVAIGLFAGALWYDKLPAIARLQVQTKGLPEGDFRDWDVIRAWALEAGGALGLGG